MADVFSRTEVAFGGAMTSQFGLLVPIPGVLTGVLLQNLQLSYRQSMTRLYEIGSAGQLTRVYYVSGRSQGDIAAAHIIGPGLSILNFYNRFSDVCNAPRNTLELTLGPNMCNINGALVNEAVRLTYIAKFCVLTQIGIAVNSQEFVVNESSALTFQGLEMRDGTATAASAQQDPGAGAGGIVGASGDAGAAAEPLVLDRVLSSQP